MDHWEPTLKQYAHFDAPLSKKELRRLCNSPLAVAKNPFFPFLRFEQSWQPYRKLPRPSRKERIIRYASHRDASIYSKYRWDLSELYEAQVSVEGLSANILAYRCVLGVTGKGKSNIDFALDAINKVRAYEDCYVIALDISKFFDSIPHLKLKLTWEGLIDSSLPPDHQAVFNSLTRFSEVSRDEALVRLGYASWKYYGIERKLVYLTPKKKIPKRLCDMPTFRERILGEGGSFANLRITNKSGIGIPQGAPASDLLANAYLLSLDIKIKNMVLEFNGEYFRYSDDLMIIIPNKLGIDYTSIVDFVKDGLALKGLKLSEKKTSVHRYKKVGDGHEYALLQGRGRNGYEYLGFRFDGKNIYIRDGTISGLHRRLSTAARGAAYAHVKRHAKRDLASLIESFPISKFLTRFGRVPDFRSVDDPKDWTFWTYARRAESILSGQGSRVYRQLGRHKDFVRKRISQEIANAYDKLR